MELCLKKNFKNLTINYKEQMKFYLILAGIIFISTILSAQSRYTKGTENGYSWLAMEVSQLPYNNIKYNYLSGILDKNKIISSNFPGSKRLLCDIEINELLRKGESQKFSLEDVVKEIDEFYSNENNLVIPIVFAYCYVIKKEAGQTQKELSEYKKEVIEFCKE